MPFLVLHTRRQMYRQRRLLTLFFLSSSPVINTFILSAKQLLQHTLTHSLLRWCRSPVHSTICLLPLVVCRHPSQMTNSNIGIHLRTIVKYQSSKGFRSGWLAPSRRWSPSCRLHSGHVVKYGRASFELTRYNILDKWKLIWFPIPFQRHFHRVE